MIEYKTYVGLEMSGVIKEVGYLRLEIFRQFPYLYQGDIDEEMEHIENYAKLTNSFIALAFHKSRCIGAITCCGFEENQESWNKLFIENNMNPQEYCYWGEELILQEFRGKGIGGELYKLCKSYQTSIGRKKIALCTIERPDNHPMKPNNFISVEDMLVRKGYHKHNNISITLKWPQIDNDGKEILNKLIFWTKEIVG